MDCRVFWKYLGFCELCSTGTHCNSDRNPAVTLLINHIYQQDSARCLPGRCSSHYLESSSLNSPPLILSELSLRFSHPVFVVFFFSQNNNSHHAGAAASPVAKEMVARVTYIWQLLYCIALLSLPSCERARCKIGSTLLGSLRIDLEISGGQICRPSLLISTNWRSSHCLFGGWGGG